jgi:small subunit ribosomal protein S1
VPFNNTLTLSQEVDVMVLDIDSEHHKISLGIKQCLNNPWLEFAEKHSVGDELEVVVRKE